MKDVFEKLKNKTNNKSSENKKSNKKSKNKEMIKLNEKDKYKLSILFFVLTIILFSFSFFKKNVAGETKIKSLSNRNGSIQELSNIIETNNVEIKDLKEKFDYKKDNLEFKKIEAEEAKAFLETIDLDLHLPSLLIDLDMKSKEMGVDIEILYNDKKDVKNKDDVEESSDVDDKIEKSEKSKDVEEDKEALKEKLENKKDDLEVKDESALFYKYNGNLRYINQISIPIKIEGNYSSVRNFLNYIDKLEAIDTRYVDLLSDGEKIQGSLYIHVFYKGEA